MPFNDDDCYLEPKKVALHVYEGGVWTEWDGVLNTGDIEIGAVELKDATTAARAIVSASGLLSVHTSDDITVARATGAAAVAMTVAPGVAWKLQEVRIHLSAVGTAGNLTITMDAGAGAEYDNVILTQDMTAVTNFVWQPARPLEFTATDEIDIAWANASTRTYGIEVIYSAH